MATPAFPFFNTAGTSSSTPFSFTPQQTQQPAFSFQTQAQPQQQQPFSFQTPAQPQFQPQQQQYPFGAAPTPAPVTAQQIHLVTSDKAPLTYQTKWADIYPDSQKILLQIEEKILQYRDESRRLDQCERLYDTQALKKGFELDAARISQELGGIGISIDREKASSRELMRAAKDMLKNAEVAVRSFAMLLHRFRPVLPNTTGGSTFTPSQSAATIPVSDFYSGFPAKPSAFLQQTAIKFEHQLLEYRQWVEELERILLRNVNENGGSAPELSVLQSLPAVMENVHSFFIYVAAEVESLHQLLEEMRMAFLADQRRKGMDNDPFLEADRREVARREAAAKRVHPMLNMTKSPQPSVQPAPLALPTAPGSMAVASSGQPIPATISSSAPSTSSGPLFSSFSAASNPTQSLFGTPATPLPSSNLFGSASSAFGMSQPSTSLLGSTPNPSTLFGGTAGGTSLFGAGSTSATATTKPKLRGSRRR